MTHIYRTVSFAVGLLITLAVLPESVVAQEGTADEAQADSGDIEELTVVGFSTQRPFCGGFARTGRCHKW